MANLYNLKKFDLNLLVIFECIYQHQSISKAAESLFITPSAVSQSLQRLRVQLDDPLFVRSGKGITPTAVGIHLHHYLEDNLNQIEKTLSIMASSKLTKNIVIYSPQLLFLNDIMSLIKLSREKIGYAIEHHDISIAPETAEDLLSFHKADLVISWSAVAHPAIVCKPFRREQLVLVCSKTHPRLSGQASVNQVLAEDFTFFITPEQGTKALQAAFETLLPHRTILFRSDSWISILSTLSHTDLVGIMPLAVFRYYEHQYNLQQIDMGAALPTVDIYLMYNRSSLNDTTFSQLIDDLDLGLC